MHEDDNPMTKWLDEHFQEVAARDFYRVIFPAGELDTRDAFTKGKYTGIAISVSNKKGHDGRRKTCRYSITDDLDTVDDLTATDDFCLCAPLSYAGKQRTAAGARMLYAIAVDVDHMIAKRDKPDGLISLWKQVEVAHFLPRPTFIVSSGTGLHLYYVLETPVPLFPEVAREMQDYKRALTKKIWNEAIVQIRTETEIQQEGIYQGFRMPGTMTKGGKRAIAYRTGAKVTLEYLNGFVEDKHQAKKAAKVRQRGAVSLAEAAKKWPEWYERRIVKGEPRGVWHTGRALYDWWLRQIYSGAKVGHRYYCVMMLAVFAQKCSVYDEKHNPNPVTWEELQRDAYGLVDYLESMTNTDDNHFGADDVQTALEAYQSRWITYPREAIQGRTGILIPANKRNGRTQNVHLRIARSVLEVLNSENGKVLQGRKSAAGIVKEWQQANPKGSKAECIRETGLSKPTVYKWWAADGSVDQLEMQPRQMLEQLRAKLAALEKALQDNKQQMATYNTEMQAVLAGQGGRTVNEIMADMQSLVEAGKRAGDSMQRLAEETKAFVFSLPGDQQERKQTIADLDELIAEIIALTK